MNLIRQQPRNLCISAPKTMGAAFLAVFLLAGCNSIQSIDPFTAKPQPVSCPEYLILKNAMQIQGDKNEDGKPAWHASIDRLAGKCIKDGQTITMQLGIKAVVTRLNPDISIAPMSYFVAIADGGQNILAKQNFILTPEFTGDPLSTIAIDVQDVTFPNPESIAGLVIYTGFENPPAPAAATEQK